MYSTKTRQIIYDAISAGVELTAAELVEATGIRDKTARGSLKRMCSLGIITKTNGKYARTSKEPLITYRPRWKDIYDGCPNQFTSDDIVSMGYTRPEAAGTIASMMTNEAIMIIGQKAKTGRGTPLNIYQKIKKDEKMSEKVFTIMPNPAPQQPQSLLQSIISEFTALPNKEKAVFVAKLMPNIDQKDLLDWYNVAYPNPKKFDSVQEGEVLFHPMLDEVRIEKVYPDWLCFYGNGSEWKVDKNGYIDGKKDKTPVLFFDLDDYIAWKRKK